MARRRSVDTGGYYCPECGTVQPLGEGFITCRRCGHIGLRGFDRLPRRVRCPEPDCDFQGWNDGGVNDDLGRHRRREHATQGASNPTVATDDSGSSAESAS